MADIGTTLHTAYPAEWNNPGTKADVWIHQISSISWNDGGDEGLFYADGDIYPTFGWLENLFQSIVLTTHDLSLMAVATDLLEIGDTGSLDIYAPARAEAGLSQVEDSAIKATFGAAETTGCMIESLNASGGQGGVSGLDIGFDVQSVDGTTSAMVITMVNGDALPTAAA